VSPTAGGALGYQAIGEKDVYDVIEDVKSRFRIDEDRLYLTGSSMGGGGALWLGLTRPDIWAALAPVSPAAPEEARSLAPNALNLPVHLFQGSVDPVVTPESTRLWQHDLLEIGAPVEYTEYPYARHNAGDLAYKNGAIFEWFSKFHRNRYPTRVRFVSDRYKYRRAYWVELDGLTPGTQASIDAQFTANDQIAIQTANLEGFSLDLAGHPMRSAKRPLRVTIDGQKLPPSMTVSFRRGAKGWRPGKFVPSPQGKRPGAEGPIAEAVSSGELCVYGTGGSPSVEEMKLRREEALAATELGHRSRVVSDQEVPSADLDHSDLILFGTRETNRIIASVDAQLPISLNVSAAGYGLIFVYPTHGRYVLIDSGLPWWEGADIAPREGLAFIPEKYRILLSFQDYILFKGSLATVVAEGRFDNNWKVPQSEARKMSATGAIQIK
jgi:poly(3-hydroxybutyrate) depolymerase